MLTASLACSVIANQGTQRRSTAGRIEEGRAPALVAHAALHCAALRCALLCPAVSPLSAQIEYLSAPPLTRPSLGPNQKHSKARSREGVGARIAALAARPAHSAPLYYPNHSPPKAQPAQERLT